MLTQFTQFEMKNIFTLIAIMLAFAVGTTEVHSQALDGSYTVTQGSTVTVQIGAAYQSTLRRATNISYTWTAANSSIAIQSKTSTTCTIKGVTPTDKVRLNYQCSYRYDGYARSMNFYYDITVKSNTISVTRVDMSPESATMEVGETLQLDATAYPTNATNRSISWSTDNYNVASVSTSGLVTARGAGKVWIWANARDGSGCRNYCVVTVNEPTKVETIELSASEHNMNIGDDFILSATVLPSEAYDKKLSWSSDNENVATVSDGVVTATGSGECDITCSSTDGSNVTATCHITVNEPEKHWLTMKVPNGSYAIEATNLDEITLRIIPDKDYTIHSITLNGVEQTTDGSATDITVPKLKENVTLNVVFISSDVSSNIDGISDNVDAPRVRVCNTTVYIDGLTPGQDIQVYSASGILVKKTIDTSFELAKDGVYILRIGSHTFKIAI